MKKEEKKGEKRGRMGVEKAEEGRESGTGERMGAIPSSATEIIREWTLLHLRERVFLPQRTA